HPISTFSASAAFMPSGPWLSGCPPSPSPIGPARRRSRSSTGCGTSWPMLDASLLVAHLRAPALLASADAGTWNALIRLARAESLAGQLRAVAMEAGVWDALPERARVILDDAAQLAEHSQHVARWETRQARRALRLLGAPVTLLKGAAYLHAGLPPAAGR